MPNHGVRVQPRTSGNTIVHDGAGTVIRGNLIGTNALHSSDIEHKRHRRPVAEQIIGGVTPGDRNVISGNTSFSVDSFPQRNGTTVLTVPSNLVVQGNYIGVRADGTAALANNSTGVIVAGPNTVIGAPRGYHVGACTEHATSSRVIRRTVSLSRTTTTTRQDRRRSGRCSAAPAA
jgi:hypothetical protein